MIDKDPGLGILGAIQTVSADEASRALVSSGKTIAAHTEHLRWSLNFALAFFQGRKPDADWSKTGLLKPLMMKNGITYSRLYRMNIMH